MNAQSAQPDMMLNRSMPPGTIIPELVYSDMDAAVEWLCTTFGFKERLRIGNHRFQIVFGGASVVVVAQPAHAPDAAPQAQPGDIAHSLMVQVADVDRHYEHVKQCGARIINPPTDYPFGERQYTVEDLAGRRWTFSQSIADVDPSEWGGKMMNKE